MNKNVHLISTNTDNKFIYVTNEEEIGDGEYGLCVGLVRQGFKSEQVVFRMDDEQREAMVDLGGQKKAEVLKVLLTNDPRLIADGVQEIEKSVLISFAENPDDYVEVIKMLQVRHGVEWYDLPNQVEGRDSEGIYRTIYKLKYQPKTELVKLLNEFEILEGITPEQFDEKDWARFERFVRAKAEDEEIGEKRIETEE